MKVLVCFKIVEEFDDILDTDWKADKDNNLDLSYAKKIFSYFDEAALGLALELQRAKIATEVTALTVGNADYHPLLKNLAALGINQIKRISCNHDFRFAPDIVSEIISQFVVGDGGYDLILMGSQASGGENGTTPFLLGEMLNLPVVSNVVELWQEEDGLVINAQVDGGYEKITFNTPIVAAVGNAVRPYLPLATLREKLKIKDFKEMEISQELPLNPSVISLNRLYSETVPRSCQQLELGSPKEVAQFVVDFFREGQ